jgi:Phosphoesterase family
VCGRARYRHVHQVVPRQWRPPPSGEAGGTATPASRRRPGCSSTSAGSIRWSSTGAKRAVGDEAGAQQLDRFVQETSGSTVTGVIGPDCKTPLPAHTHDQATNKLVMDYYDGNTVTALWNYAQHFTLLDNSFGRTFGPSTDGAINLVSGDRSHVIVPPGSTAVQLPFGTVSNHFEDVGDGVIIGDPDGAFDDCASKDVVIMTGRNIGDLLNAQHVTWGFFEGGFRPSSRDASGKAKMAWPSTRRPTSRPPRPWPWQPSPRAISKRTRPRRC